MSLRNCARCKTKSSTAKTVFVGNDKDLVWNRHFFGANIHPDFHCDVVLNLPHHLLAF